jgi:hypothetical protein
VEEINIPPPPKRREVNRGSYIRWKPMATYNFVVPGAESAAGVVQGV